MAAIGAQLLNIRCYQLPNDAVDRCPYMQARNTAQSAAACTLTTRKHPLQWILGQYPVYLL